MVERQVRPHGPAGRRPAGRVPHQPGQDRAAQGGRGPGDGRGPGGRDGPHPDRRPPPPADRLPARRADPAGGRPDAAGAGALEPAEQRRQVHRAGRPDPPDAPSGRGARSSCGSGTRASASRRRCCRGSSTCSCRSATHRSARPGRAGHRADPGADAGRDARRHGRGPQRRAGPGQRVRRPAARSLAEPGEVATPDRGRRPGPGRPSRRVVASWSWTTTWTPPTAWLRLLAGCTARRSRVAYDGPAALAAAEAFRPEVVLLDIGLPGMDGYEVARRLRGRPEFGKTLLVALTGWGQESDGSGPGRRASITIWSSRRTPRPILGLLRKAGVSEG